MTTNAPWKAGSPGCWTRLVTASSISSMSISACARSCCSYRAPKGPTRSRATARTESYGATTMRTAVMAPTATIGCGTARAIVAMSRTGRHADRTCSTEVACRRSRGATTSAACAKSSTRQTPSVAISNRASMGRASTATAGFSARWTGTVRRAPTAISGLARRAATGAAIVLRRTGTATSTTVAGRGRWMLRRRASRSSRSAM